MSKYSVLLLFLLLTVLACKEQKQEPIVTPWGAVLQDTAEVNEDFDLAEIQGAGELIMGTVSSPLTCYDYRGRQLGIQFLILQRLATRLGVSLRVDLCRDSAEVAEKLQCGDIDIAAWMTPGQFSVSPEKPLLNDEFTDWYKPELVYEVKKEEAFLLSSRSVRRRVFSPMLDKKGGIISKYDHLFVTYSRPIRWDWRLMAAQCYQESTFDPRATSWAGAKGLMQIMPGTADHLGVARDKMYDPEQNIAAASRYLAELERSFSDIGDRSERTNFVLASYNGGAHHVRDAMALCRRDGGNQHRWREVEPYVLKLAQPQYYNDPLVKHGYMRGSETVDYVQKIRQRHRGYMGVKTPHLGYQAGRHPRYRSERKKKYDL
jgi:membrane-bound lytic murein transglycosylase F